MQLRRYSGLLLTLLHLMMQSNLPELSDKTDIGLPFCHDHGLNVSVLCFKGTCNT